MELLSCACSGCARLDPLRLSHGGLDFIKVQHIRVASEAVVVWGERLELLLAYVDPRVVKDVLGRGTHVRLLLENLVEKLLGLRGDVVGDLEVLCADVRVEFLVVLAFEWESSTQQSEQ